jgi:ABC-type cobalamin/Fe3+-siderophores transport system ATPase subunit
MKITLRNYRAFDDSKPAEWELADDFRAFVGINNAGKSSLLRLFYEIRPALILFCGDNINAQSMVYGGSEAPGFRGVADPSEVFCNRNQRNMSLTFALDKPERPDATVEPSNITFTWDRAGGQVTVSYMVGKSLVEPEGSGDLNNPWFRVGSERTQVSLVRYRTIFRELAESFYLGAFRNAVNVGSNNDYYDLQIGQAFISQWDTYKTGQNRAQNRMALAVEKELQQIFGLKSLQINAAPGDQTLQIIANGEPYQLSEQGAGLAQFIVVLAFIATRRPPYVFIDEPEQNLHPSLQLDFLTTLAKYTTHGVVFATHSIGLARAVAQEIYSVRRLPDESREVRQLAATRNYVEFLGELSLSGYEELGFKQVLLVEGTTEVPTIQRWLRLYGVEHEVVLVPMGGASLINGRSEQALAEIKRITNQVAVLIDSERLTAGDPIASDRQEFVTKCEALGFSVHVLERRALENYLTDAAVKSVKGDAYTALGPFDLLKDQNPAWGKQENWRIAAEMTKHDLDATDLGSFLQTLGDDEDPA